MGECVVVFVLLGVVDGWLFVVGWVWVLVGGEFESGVGGKGLYCIGFECIVGWIVFYVCGLLSVEVEKYFFVKV